MRLKLAQSYLHGPQKWISSVWFPWPFIAILYFFPGKSDIDTFEITFEQRFLNAFVFASGDSEFPIPTQPDHNPANIATDLCTEYVIGLGDQKTLKPDIPISSENKSSWSCIRVNLWWGLRRKKMPAYSF